MEVPLLQELKPPKKGFLVLGSLTEDWVEAPGVKLEGELGGSAAYFALTARHFGPVSVVGAVGPDREADVREVLAFADLSGLTVTEEPTYAWHGRRAEIGGEAETLSRFTAGSSGYRPVLPQAADWPADVFLASFNPETQLEVAMAAPAGARVAGDTMDFFIRDQPAAVDRMIARVRLLFVTNAELLALTGSDDVAVGAGALLARHPLETVVVKLGTAGVDAFTRFGRVTLPACAANVVDPTGCGDSVAAATLGRLRESGIDGLDGVVEALHWGLAAAAINIEGIGMRSVSLATRADLERRVEAYYAQLG